VEEQPDESGWWILWAFAARRAESLKRAEKILLMAEAKHPKDATIQFNLGCYACQLGNLAAAKTRVRQAVSLDNSFLKHALEDSDLQPLRDVEPDWLNAGNEESSA
jgi:Tfp pilus assembly protein PilF